jgi:hypothetical protein
MLRVLVLNLKSRSSNKYDISNRRSLDVKWRGLDFTLLLNSALKSLTLPWQTACVLSTDCRSENGHTADCQSPKPTFESRLPQVWTVRRVHIRSEGGGWQSAVQLRADCQAVILIVAICRIRAQTLAIEWNPAPAILHREAPCLTHHRFLTRDFTSVKLIRGAMVRLKLYTHALSWHTISWYYTFNIKPWIGCELVKQIWK